MVPEERILLNSAVTSILSRLSKINDTCLDNVHAKLSERTNVLQQQLSNRQQGHNIYKHLIKQLEDEAASADKNLQSKQEEQKCLFQSKLKEMQSLKKEAENKLKEDKALFENDCNKVEVLDEKYGSLKEEVRTVIKKENSYLGRGEAIFQFFLYSFNVYFSHSSLPEKLEGCIKGEDVALFAFDKDEASKKDIADNIWSLIESS